MKILKIIIVVMLVSIFLLYIGNGEVKEVEAQSSSIFSGKVKNIIFMIPDGYSTSYASNYRIYKEDSEPVWDSLLVGMMKTKSANNLVTDSAAAGTAMATGVKTNNGVISMTPNGKELTSILQVASDKGKATGLVATSTITHPTPAAFAASTQDRENEADIARQYIDNEVDVLLGGGVREFIPQFMGGSQEGRHLLLEAMEKGYEVVGSKEKLFSVKGNKLIGLFAYSGMAPELDREHTDEPSLAEMTRKAIEVLRKNADGFFLMVEGSQIDWAGHAQDAAWTMKDIEAFEFAVEEALEFAKKDNNTLVVVVGDHDTGGMSVGAYDKYRSKVELLRDVTATGNYMSNQLNADLSNIKEVLLKYANLHLTGNELNRIKGASNSALAINKIISERAFVGWTSTVHTGVDVPLYAYGPGSNLFRGFIDNTDVPLFMEEVMGIKFQY